MNNKLLSAFDWFLIVGVIVSNVFYSLLSGNVDIVGSVAGIAGVLCVVLVAKGSIWNYAFGLVNVVLYAYISYKASLYGDAHAAVMVIMWVFYLMNSLNGLRVWAGLSRDAEVEGYYL